jgi:hypothetical protein
MPEMHRVTEAAMITKAAQPNRDIVTASNFASLQTFGANIAPGGVPTLARLLPDSLRALHLKLSDRGTAGCYSGCARSYVSEAAAAAAAEATVSPIAQLFANGNRRDAAAPAQAPFASRFPCLRELELRYERGPRSGAELLVLRGLPQLEVLTIGCWDGDRSGVRCWNCASLSRWDADALEVKDFTDDDLARLVAGLPRLRRLTLELVGGLSDAALHIVGRACRLLEHLELRGSFGLYQVCHAAEADVDECGRNSPLFPKLHLLRISGISRLLELDEQLQDHLSSESDDLDEPNQSDEPHGPAGPEKELKQQKEIGSEAKKRSV